MKNENWKKTLIARNKKGSLEVEKISCKNGKYEVKY